MALCQLCFNQENDQLSIGPRPRTRGGSRDRTARRRESADAPQKSSHYAVPKLHLTSRSLLKSQARERMVDARIVEKVLFSQQLAASQKLSSSTSSSKSYDDKRYQEARKHYKLAPLDTTFLTREQIEYCTNADFFE